MAQPSEASRVSDWPDDIDEILDGDVVVGLAYRTPAGGAVVTGVSPIGLRDRSAGTVGFTTSLGFGRKLERIRRFPQVALAYHAREHGFSNRPDYVLVQGSVSSVVLPDEAYLRREIGARSARYLGPPRTGLFWDRWLRVYYRDRVVVTVDVERIVRWPGTSSGVEPEVLGRPLWVERIAQSEPKHGTGPRVDSRRAMRRLQALPHRLLAFVAADGMPMVLPVSVTATDERGLSLRTDRGVLPAGSFRAGILGHKFYEHVAGLTSRQYTGWLTVEEPEAGTATYAPHTERGLVIPHSKTVALLLNGLAATITYRQAQKAGRESLLDVKR
jgi:hypothetical protein